MQKFRTITIEEGHVRKCMWIVVKCAALTIAGILLFRAGAAYVNAQRGYEAIGGEIFILFIPTICYEFFVKIWEYITAKRKHSCTQKNK